MSNIIRSKMTEADFPLTAAEKAELASLKAKSDEEIDTQDMAELDENFFLQAMQNPFYKAKKTSTTIRLDADVLSWLKSQGKGYQTRINQILRAEMLNSLQAK